MVGGKRLGADLPFADPVQARLQGGIGDPQGHGRHFNATPVQHRHCRVEAGTFDAQQCRFGQPAVQGQLIDRAATQSHGFFRTGEADPYRSLGNHEGADALVAGFSVGLGIEHNEACFAGIGDVVLTAAHPPTAIFTLRTAAHVGRVGACCRLRQCEGAE
ncbi:hypothetical protein D3C86_1521030 [compost metagenome]